MGPVFAISFAEDKKKEIDASKIYSPVDNLAERAKNVKLVQCRGLCQSHMKLACFRYTKQGM